MKAEEREKMMKLLVYGQLHQRLSIAFYEAENALKAGELAGAWKGVISEEGLERIKRDVRNHGRLLLAAIESKANEILGNVEEGDDE